MATATITVASAAGDVAADTDTVVADAAATTSEVAADSSEVSTTDKKTGDSAMPVVYVSLMVLAAVAFVTNKKRKNA